MKIVSGQDMAKIDQWTTEERRVPGLLLMENAGRAVAAAAWKYIDPVKNQAVIVAGKGNNGGDGLVAARHLHQWGADVRLFLLRDPEEFAGAARENWGFIENLDLRWYVLKDKNSFYPLKLCLETAAVAVDAMFGIGFKGELADNYLAAAQALNSGNAPVVAVDIPSGVDADTGVAAEGAVKSRETVTFAYAKQGLYMYPARQFTGKVSVEDISIPKGALETLTSTAEWVDTALARSLLPLAREDSHKGDFGHVLSIAGNRGMTGAALLAARAALRCGAGMVTSGLPDSLADGFDLAFAEGMTVALAEKKTGLLSPEAAAEITRAGQNKDVLLFGPGLARDDALASILMDVLTSWKKPAVIDAGGLWALSRNKDIAANAAGPLALTPHPGELGLLLGVTAADVMRDRPGAAREAAREYGAVVVLKGASTLITDPKGVLYINSTGNPILATAGSGDVLAGALAALIAQGLSPLDASVLAAYLHGRAGDLLGEEYGRRGGLAGEVAEYLPLAMKELRK